MNKRTYWVGLLIALTMPVWGYLIPVAADGDSTWVGQVIRWLVLSFFFLVIWWLNGRLYALLRRKEGITLPIQLFTVLVADALVVFVFRWSMSAWGTLSSFGDFESWQVGLYFSVMVLALVQFILVLLLKAKTSGLQNEQLRRERQLAELEGLKQEVIPHFLFNALGMLRVMIREKDASAEPYVLSLSAAYRQFLNQRTETTASLADELELLENCLTMIRCRLEGLSVNIDLEGAQKNGRLPVFCLQQLVINCVKHNIATPAAPLRVRVYQQRPGTITVENNKQLKINGVESMGMDLANLCKRYKLLGVSGGISVWETDRSFAVTLTLLDP